MIELPQNYDKLTTAQRKKVREEYVRIQKGRCYYCDTPLSGPPSKHIRATKLTMGLFPPGFLRWPVHLHHDHNTGMTIGAVHAKCNGVLWEYHGE